MGFDDSPQAERDTEVLLKSDLHPQGETALMTLQRMVDSRHTNDLNTSPLAAQQFFWENSLQVFQSGDLEGPGNQSDFQSASHERMQTQQLATRSDAEVQTEASLDAIARNAKGNWLKPTLLVAIAIVILVLIAITVWHFWSSGFFRHY